jgi:Rho-binding antiterminator
VYTPINCEFHDVLEALATLRKQARIHTRDEAGAEHAIDATITDIFARDGVEYIALNTGQTVRLDHIVAIDDARPADF